ncbi:MAG: helix-turn-helix domain-containing protein [Candidatus Gastranaerophilaceae bacterium]
MQHKGKKNLEILAKKIKSLREERSKSLNRFVFERGGITGATWSRIENAKVDLKFTTLVKVAAMLNIKVEELFSKLDLDYSLDED